MKQTTEKKNMYAEKLDTSDAIYIACRFYAKKAYRIYKARLINQLYGGRREFLTMLEWHASQLDVSDDYCGTQKITYIVRGLTSKVNREIDDFWQLGRCNKKHDARGNIPLQMLEKEDSNAPEDWLTALIDDGSWRIGVDSETDRNFYRQKIKQMLGDYDARNGTNYLDKYTKLLAVGFSPRMASERWGTSRQNWHSHFLQIVKICGGVWQSQQGKAWS